MNKTFISQLQGGKYQVNSLIGSGGFGNTYLAVQVALGRKVAIKEFFMKEFCERDESTLQVIVPTEGSRLVVDRYKQKFLKEAQMIASLRNEHIIKIYDIFEENNTAYYVMDYIEGGSLKDTVNTHGPLSEIVAIRYINQISNALSYLHTNNILHLDIKPSNILIDKDDRLLLIDFGVSKHYDDDGGQTSTTPAGISKGYAPIEQYQQESIANFSPATDIYSLGATMFFLLTGKTPPEASIVNEDGLPTDIENFTNQTKAVIIKSMSPRRKDRYQNIPDFINALTSNNTDGSTFARIAKTEETIIITSPARITVNQKPEHKSVTSQQNKKPKLYKILIICTILGLGIITPFLFKIFKDTAPEVIKENVPDITNVVPIILETPNFKGMTLPNPNKLGYSLVQESRTSNDITDDNVWIAKYMSSQQSITYNFLENRKNQPNDYLKSKVPVMLHGKYRCYVRVTNKYNIIGYGEKSLCHDNVSIDANLIIVTDPTFSKVLYAYDFSNYSLDKLSKSSDLDFTKISVENVIIENNTLYATVGHSTYASSSSGYNAYLVAIDLNSQKVKWMTEPLTTNSPFCIYDDTIITGYGYTDEQDYIYVIDKSTGCRLKSIKVANGPELFSIKDGKLYVRTYSYDYVFRLNEVRNITSTSSSASQSQTTPLPPPPTPKTNSDSAGAEIKDYIEEDEETLGEEPIPYQLVETKPTFLGGDANQFSQWVSSKLQYPEDAIENGVQGRVVLQFTVQKDGSLANVKILRGVSVLLDNEAIRVVSMSPKWQPGTQRGKVVPVTLTFPVIFQLR